MTELKTKAEEVTGIIVRSVALVLCGYGIVSTLMSIIPYVAMLERSSWDMVTHVAVQILPPAVLIVCGWVLYHFESRVTEWIVRAET